MPVQSKSKSANEVLFRLSILCQDLYIDEHVALENQNVRKQLAVKESLNDKMTALRKIMESEF